MFWPILAIIFLVGVLVLAIYVYVKDKRYMRRRVKEVLSEELKEEIEQEREQALARGEKFKKALEEARKLTENGKR